MNFAIKEIIIENFRKVLKQIKSRNYNSKLLSYLLILVYFANLVSSLLYDKFSITKNHQIDELFLNIIYYSDLSHIFRDIIENDHILMIIFIVIHTISIVFYILLCGFHDTIAQTDSRIINFVYDLLSLYQKIYIWIITYPSFSLIIYFFMHKSYSSLFIIEACSLSILICLWYYILYFTQFQTAFLPEDEFVMVFTNNSYVLVLSALAISIFRIVLPIINYTQIMVYIGILISILKIFIYWRDLPFIDENLSKFYGSIVHIEPYLMILISVYQSSYQNYTITGLFIIGTLFIIQTFLYIRNNYILSFLFSPKIEKISDAKFYFLIKKVIEWIKAPIKQRKSSTMYLIMFIKGHFYSCKDQSCICKTLSLSLSSIDIVTKKNLNQYEKTFIVLKYKDLIYQIILNYFELKINSHTNKTDNIELKLSEILFLTYHAKHHIKAYVMICTLINNKIKLGRKFNLILKYIREEMEEFIFGEERKSNSVLFKDVLDFYDMLQKLKEIIMKVMNHYFEFLYKLTSTTIDLDYILTKGKEILIDRKNIYSMIYILKNINRNHKELNDIINLYTSLSTVDDLNMKYLNTKMISIERTNYKNESKKLDKFIGSNSTLYELFGLKNCIIFIELTSARLGMIKKVTPNFAKMFGYSPSHAKLFNVSHLMPLIFGLYHKSFISNFIEKNKSTKLDATINDGYGLHKDGYIFMIDIYAKMECFNGELCIAGCIHKKDNVREVVLTTSNGYITNFTSGLQELLFLPVNMGKPIYELPLPLIVPRLILTMGVKINKLKEIYKYFNKNGIPNFELMIGNTEINNPIIQTGDISDELVYAFFPKSKELIDEIMISFKQIANIDIQDENIMFEEYVKGMKFIYEKYDENAFFVYKMLISYKERKFRGGTLHIRVFDMIYPSLAKNPIQAYDSARNYLKNLEQFYYNHDSIDIFHQFSTALMNLSPLYHRDHNKQIYGKDTTQDIIYASNMQIDSMDDLDISERQYANQIFISKEIHSQREIFTSRKTNNTISPRDIKYSLLNDLNSPNTSVLNHLLYFPKVMLTDEIIETKDLIQITSKNTQFLTSEPMALIDYNNPKFETSYDHIGITSRKRLLLPSNEQYGSFSPPNLNEVPLSKFSLKKPDDTRKTRGLADQLEVLSNIRRKARIRTDRAVLSDIYSEENKINAVPGSHPKTKIQTQSNKPYFQISSQSQKIKEIQEFEDRQSTNSRASSTATNTKRFRSLLSDDISVDILDQVNGFGGFSISILIGIILAIFIISQQSSHKFLLYIKTANFTDRLLSPIATYGKYIELKALYNNNLLTNLDFNLMENTTINLLTLKEKEFRNAYEDIISGDHLLNDLFSLNYSDYNFNITLLNEDNTTSNYVYSFYYGIQTILENFDVINHIINNNYTNDNNKFNYTQNSLKYYLNANFPVYFETLMKIGYNIDNEVNNGSNPNLKKFSITMLILFICIALIISLSIYPIFKYVETKKFKGLSLMSTFSIKDIESIQTEVKYILMALENLNSIGITPRSKNFFLKREKGKSKNSKKSKEKIRIMRDWQAKKTNPWKFISIIVIALGLLITYFTINNLRIIHHNEELNQFYNEFKISNDLTSCIQTEYYITYHTLNFYSYDTIWQRNFNQSYSLIITKCKQKIEQIRFFWQIIDAYINDNSEITNTYETLLHALKSSDLCKIIDSIDMTSQMLIECQNALYNAPMNGFIQLINSIHNSLKSFIQVSMNDPTQINSIALIKSLDFQGLDILMYYSNFIFARYIKGIRINIEEVLSKQLIEGYILLFMGILLILLIYIVIWIPLLKYTKMEFKTVKKIYCLFPLDMIITNQYIKKWLEDNAKRID